VAGRKTCLFAFIDDHSRAVMAARFGFAEDTIRLAAALRPALASRGAPEHVYVDNGSAFVDAWLMRACARLGIELVHSQPGRPQGRGKIERFFRTVRGQFLAELTEERAAQVKDLAELNRLFTAWAETVHHPREHSETGQAPLARWEAGGPFPLPAAASLAAAFRWPEWRTVTKTATVSMHGNRYQVDPGLAGRRAEPLPGDDAPRDRHRLPRPARRAARQAGRRQGQLRRPRPARRRRRAGGPRETGSGGPGNRRRGRLP